MRNASHAVLFGITVMVAACANVEPPKAPQAGTREWYYRNAGEIHKRANSAYWDCVEHRSGQCQKETDDLAQAEALKDAAQVHRVHELGGSSYRLGY